MNFGIAFSPLVPAYVLWVALAVTLLLAVMLVMARSRGALVRSLALALFVLALANPSLTREDRDPLTSIAAVIIDKSPSQEFGDRTTQTEGARARGGDLCTAPRCGIVGQSQHTTCRVQDQGIPPGTAQVAIRRDGETLENRSV